MVEKGRHANSGKAAMSDLNLGEVRTIGGRPFRAGFLAAEWGTALDESLSYATRLQAKRENILALAGEVYHYTSVAGFQGIVDTCGFWASDNRFMNDSEELENGSRLAAEVLDKCAQSACSSKFAKVLKEVRKRIAAKRKVGYLVACFSLMRDSLDQWRGYGGAGGVCINVGGSSPDQRPFSFGPDQLLFRAVYQWRPKVVLCLSIIRRYRQEYDRDRQAMPEFWPDDHDEEYIESLRKKLSAQIVVFKNEAFVHESEVRFVIPYSYEEHYEGGLRFRNSPLGLVPYVNTGHRKGITGLLPIKEVIVGPSARQDLVGESVRTFLDHRGYSHVPVTLSTVPYRST